MSELRTQLDQMRDAYRGQRYPGDLASEILSPPRKLPVARIVAAAGFLAAAAAAIVVWVAVFPMAHDRGEIADGDLPTREFAVIPEFPSDLPLIPQAEPLHEIGGMPEMPSVDLSFDFSSVSEPSEELS